MEWITDMMSDNLLFLM